MDISLHCPIPLSDHTTVQMAHGGGGRLMRGLIENVFRPAFAAGGRGDLGPAHDSAVVEIGGQRLAFTTDTFVISPLVFPGGDIGKLAVCGTVNDLAMAGARPVALSAAYILEEGFSIELLREITNSLAATAAAVGVPVVTGDTKVVDRGKGDGLFVNTAGIGLVAPGVDIRPQRVAPGDKVIVSGDLGRHGIAIMSVREGLQFETALTSDCEPLWGLVEAMLAAAPADIHCLRDLTRGGLAAALNEIAMDVGVGIELQESAIAVSPPVAGACELLGLDPLYVANEGRLVAFVAAEKADAVLKAMQSHSSAHGPAIVGEVVAAHAGVVELQGLLGVGRIVDLLSGEQMPRIC